LSEDDDDDDDDGAQTFCIRKKMRKMEEVGNGRKEGRKEGRKKACLLAYAVLRLKVFWVTIKFIFMVDS
jgi:hypothetical protein